MTYIKLSLIAEVGRYPSSRAKGALFRRQIKAALGGGATSAMIDLEGIEAMSDSFADEVFGVLAAQHGKEWFKKHITLVNLTPTIREDLLAVLRRRTKSAPLTASLARHAHA